MVHEYDNLSRKSNLRAMHPEASIIRWHSERCASVFDSVTDAINHPSATLKQK